MKFVVWSSFLFPMLIYWLLKWALWRLHNHFHCFNQWDFHLLIQRKSLIVVLYCNATTGSKYNIWENMYMSMIQRTTSSINAVNVIEYTYWRWYWLINPTSRFPLSWLLPSPCVFTFLVLERSLKSRLIKTWCEFITLRTVLTKISTSVFTGYFLPYFVVCVSVSTPLGIQCVSMCFTTTSVRRIYKPLIWCWVLPL